MVVTLCTETFDESSKELQETQQEEGIAYRNELGENESLRGEGTKHSFGS